MKLRNSIAAALAVLSLAVLLVGASGCAKYNTFFNANRLFQKAEQVREDAIRAHLDPPSPAGTQKADYEEAIKKAQKLIDEYPGHSLTDDALFLQAKAYYRLESYRMSIRKFDLLFTNFPATPFAEEALFLQSLNYLMLGTVSLSQEYLDKLAKQFPESDFQSQTLKVSGDNAYAMENWDEAARHFRDFLAQFPDAEDWDRVGIKLGECLWELEDYDGTARVLQEVAEKTSSAEVAFQAGLIRARALIRTGEFDLAKELLDRLDESAEIYNSQGEVLLAEVDLLIAQGNPDAAFPLLETMPETWKTPQVKAKLGDTMGNLRLGRQEYEEAQTSFREALMGRAFLEDELRTNRLTGHLNDYLSAENALSDARPERVPGLKLLQANALLFGFERPAEAVTLYREAAVDSAADSTVAARALYGAAMVYRRYLIRPDSAAFFEALLEQRYPDSPQAYEVGHTDGGNLLSFLLQRREAEQTVRYAELSDEELADLNRVKDFAAPSEQRPGIAVLPIRRRQVYLARRPNIVYPPPELALAAARLARDGDPARAAAEGPPGGVDPSGTGGPPVQSPTVTNPNVTGGQAARDLGAEPDPTLLPEGNPEGASSAEEAAAEEVDAEPTAGEEDEAEEEKPEEPKKTKRSWEFDLNSPRPAPGCAP